MFATNHALTGAVIGLTVHNPVIALPVALVSHLVCDVIPHWTIDDPAWIGSRSMKVYLLIDAALCGVIVSILFLSHNPNWLLASACAFVAASPDFLWIPRFIAAQKHKNYKLNTLERFLGWIQWFQRPIGLFVEIAWAAGAIALLSAIL